MILLKTAEPKAFHDLLGRGLKPTSLCRPGRAHQPISFTCQVMPAFLLTHSPVLFRHRTKTKSCVLAPGQQAHATRLKPLLVGCQDPTLPNARWPPFVFCTLSVSFIQFCHKQIVHLSYLVLSREISFDWHHLQSQSEIQKWLVFC